VKRQKIFTMLAAAAGTALTAAVMTATPARADTVPTSTTLELASHQVVLGQEFNFAMSIGVNATSGSWTISAGSAATGLITLCSGDVSTSTGCFMPPGALPPGNYNLVAVYAGNENFSESASDLEPLAVIAQQPTATSLTLSSPSVPFGKEQTETLTAKVTPGTSGTPTGNVTVKAGATTLCTIVLANGAGNCTLTSRQLARGSYQVTATYNGDTAYASSTSSPPQTLAVTRR
jgi:Bacterial Ig-like domain (group 3)